MFESDYGLSADQHGRYYYERLKLVEIDFGNSFITDNVTDMSYMFILSGELTSIDLSNFNTEKVTDMSGMFWCCWKLTRLDVSSFNTVNVTDMSEMFWGCESMTNLNLSHFDMSGVSKKQCMCRNLSTESGACTITCPTAVRTALENGTDLPTSGVVFTWVTP